ncbi:uncharacterized protein LACBIDRAFT_326700 [Laccaria bicolor S238N-H82]|uniref:Predicted protein n=1 Tax=Laccaria bicolor (strain S238N-H82 / ATCC MYA-4686) TaxID=486041 RepID=B0D9F1_LACBS|nr:uncharacterized protein LACBIDRAFT_326700 [Laccaria bicolor S238N-H82]EDR08567.1 predicted protein [Laccaria bicolor S238N-H82]|eukprot:XP_001880792.1 predicted protein [Laccaria bicolor S238N-H82]
MGSTTKRYREELPKILMSMNGGGPGEMEETMMWYAVSHEKAEEEDWIRSRASWVDDKWRKFSLDRMERMKTVGRVQILSLPGPTPPPPPLGWPKKHKDYSSATGCPLSHLQGSLEDIHGQTVNLATTRPQAAVTQRKHTQRHLLILAPCPSLSSKNEDTKNARGPVGVNKKRVFNSEVNMSRVVKHMPKMQRTESKKELAVGKGEEKAVGKTTNLEGLQCQVDSQSKGGQRLAAGRSTSSSYWARDLFGFGRPKMGNWKTQAILSRSDSPITKIMKILFPPAREKILVVRATTPKTFSRRSKAIFRASKAELETMWSSSRI